MWRFAGVPVCACLAPAQSVSRSAHERSTPLLEIAPLKRFQDTQFLAVSPDSTRLCLYRFQHPETGLRAWSYDGGTSTKKDDVLQVMELQTGKLVYATQLRTMVESLSFFADGGRLYAETMSMSNTDNSRISVRQRAVIDLATHELMERLSQDRNLYIALGGESLLGHHTDQGLYSIRRSTDQASTLVLANLPEYKEVAREPFAVAQESGHYGRPRAFGDGMHWGYDTMPVVSGDKKTVAYGTGHYLVCRRANDLGLLWKRIIEPEYFGVWLVDLTPDAKTVVAAVIGGSSMADRDRFYVGVYSGADGSAIAKLPLNGFGGISISPDGKLLAVSQQVVLTDGKAEPTVNIYEIASGSQIGRVSHPAVSISGFGNSGKAAIGSRFTPDGRYLITSGVSDTMVWALTRH